MGTWLYWERCDNSQALGAPGGAGYLHEPSGMHSWKIGPTKSEGTSIQLFPAHVIDTPTEHLTVLFHILSVIHQHSELPGLLVHGR